eukprot:7264214-Prymnesium_polylepis.1
MPPSQVAAAIHAHGRLHLSSSGMATYFLTTLRRRGKHVTASTSARHTPAGDSAPTDGLETYAPLLFVGHCSEDFTSDSLLYGLQRVLGADRVVDVAFDTDGMQHPWCDTVSRTERKKPSLRAPPPAPVDGIPARFALFGRHLDSNSISRENLAARIVAREFGAIVFGCAARTLGGLLEVVRANYAPERVAFVYGEDMPYPLHAGWPMEGIQRPRGSTATLPSVAQAARWGVVFQREIYDEPSATPLRQQTLMVPGVGDPWSQPYTIPLP